MNDSEAIVNYQSAARYLQILDKYGPPVVPLLYPPDKQDRSAQNRALQLHERSRRQPLQVLDQAERTVRALPRPEWRDAMRLIYFEGMSVWEAALDMAYSERAVYRFLRQGFDYIEAAQEQAREGRK